MKHLSASFTKLIAAVACTLTLGSCARSEYAMLPKTSSYHGESRMATTVPADKAPVAAPAAEQAEVAVAPSVASAPAIAPIVAPAAPKAAVATTVPVAKPAAAPAATAVVAAPARKLNAFQRLAVSGVARKIEKATQKVTTFRQHDNKASTSALNGKLRQGIILLLVGLLVGIIGGAVGGSIGNLIGLLGLIIAIIGIVLIILYLLDSV